MKEATLPIMLMTRVGQMMTPAPIGQHNSQCSIETDGDSIAELNQSIYTSCNNTSSAESEVFRVLVDVLFQIHTTPEVLAQVIVPVFDR